MASPRETQFQKLSEDFPESPMGHFSLGRLYLEERRYAEAVTALEKAVGADGTYAAALVSLGEAYLGMGNVASARTTWETARDHALAQKHPGLAEEIEEKLRDL